MSWAEGFIVTQFLLCFLCMNTRDTATAFFQETSNIRSLFRALWGVIVAWVTARRHRTLDFRQVQQNEVTSEMHTRIDAVRSAPEEDFVNI
jgi:hypothetical protein